MASKEVTSGQKVDLDLGGKLLPLQLIKEGSVVGKRDLEWQIQDGGTIKVGIEPDEVVIRYRSKHGGRVETIQWTRKENPDEGSGLDVLVEKADPKSPAHLTVSRSMPLTILRYKDQLGEVDGQVERVLDVAELISRMP